MAEWLASILDWHRKAREGSIVQVPGFVINAKCVFCHKGNEPPDLREEVSYEVLTTEGWVVKGDANSSILYKSLLGVDGVPLMPTTGKLPDEQIEWVEEWINDGAPDN